MALNASQHGTPDDARGLRRSAEETARELVEFNEQLRDSLIYISSGTDYDEKLRHVLTYAVRQLHSAGACIFLHDPEKDTLQIVASADQPPPSVVDGTTRLPSRCTEVFAAAQHPIWRTFQETRDPVVLDVRVKADACRIRPEARHWHLAEGRPVIMGLPVVIERRVLGYISVTFNEVGTKEDISSESMMVGKSLASLLGMIIDTHRLSRRAQDAAIAEEKNRLAQELHDTLAGAFTGIFMQLQAANDLHQEDHLRRQTLTRKAEDLAQTGLRQLREFVHTLAFSDGDPDRVIAQMREIVDSAADDTRVRTRFTVIGREKRLKPTVANAFLRILREAIGNIQRYAAAATILVTVQFEASGASLMVADDGKGFVLNELSDSGFGIPGMRARMHRLGGTLKVETAPGAGTKITAALRDCCEADSIHE